MLSWILTRREDECLVKLCAELGKIESAVVRCLLFDGCVVQIKSEGAREKIEDVLREMPSIIGMSVVVKPWESRKLEDSPFAASLILTGKARLDTRCETPLCQSGFAEDCLFEAVRYVDFTGGAPKSPGNGPFCVSDFNTLSASSTNGGGIPQLENTSVRNVTHGNFVAFTRLPQGGHFFGVRMLGDGTVTLFDGICRKPAIVEGALFLRELSAREGSLLFRLVSVAFPIVDRAGRYACLGGAGSPLRAWDNTRTPLARCFFCSCRLAPHRRVDVDVLTESGPIQITDVKARCVGKSCRALHSNNYARRPGGSKVNTCARVVDLGKVLLVNSNSGVSVSYVAQHYARTFRAGTNPTSESSTMTRWMCDTGYGGIGTFGERRMRETLRAATVYYMRLLDIQSGVEPVETYKLQEIDFDVDNPLLSSPLYVGDDINGFVVYSARRDGPYIGASVQCIISDGNQVNARNLEAGDLVLRNAARPRGRPKGSLTYYSVYLLIRGFFYVTKSGNG